MLFLAVLSSLIYITPTWLQFALQTLFFLKHKNKQFLALYATSELVDLLGIPLYFFPVVVLIFIVSDTRTHFSLHSTHWVEQFEAEIREIDLDLSALVSYLSHTGLDPNPTQ